VRDLRRVDANNKNDLERDLELFGRDVGAAIKRLQKGQKPTAQGVSGKFAVAQQAPSDSGIIGAPTTSVVKLVGTYSGATPVAFDGVFPAGDYRLSTFIYPAAAPPASTLGLGLSFDDTGLAGTNTFDILTASPITQDVYASTTTVFHHGGGFGLGIGVTVSAGATCQIWFTIESL